MFILEASNTTKSWRTLLLIGSLHAPEEKLGLSFDQCIVVDGDKKTQKPVLNH